jgi:predicted lipase
MNPYKEYAISAMLAKFAYSDHETLSDLWFKMRDSKRNNFSNVFKDIREVPEFYSDSKTGAQAFSLVREGSLIFVFRGTSELQDVLVNLDIKRVRYLDGPMLVHAGFLKQFESLKLALVKTVEKYSGKVEKILCIGHSLGGALATLTSGHFGSIYNGKIPVTCHTFGSPRVGNVAYAEWFSRQVAFHVRVMNEKDPVTQMPISHRFQHCSDAMCVKEDLTVDIVADTKWYWRILRFKSNCCFPVLAHTCDQYIDHMVKLYKENSLELRVEG